MANERRDPDQEYLVGCSSAGIIGLIVLAAPVTLCMLDYYGTKTVYTSQGLKQLVVISGAIAFFAGLIGSWVAKIAGIFGTLGGFACGAAFWFMHIQQSIAKAPSDIGKFPDYTDATMWIIPICWFLIGAIVSLPFLARRQKTTTD
jgi:hypothetical protein